MLTNFMPNYGALVHFIPDYFMFNTPAYLCHLIEFQVNASTYWKKNFCLGGGGGGVREKIAVHS